MNLSDFQKHFIDAFFGAKKDVSFMSSITPAGKLANADEALKIHQRGYICRLTEALQETYEGVWSVLGDEAFFQTCEDFILSNPSATYNLSHYGRNFADYLKGTCHSKDFPFLSDLARLDRTFCDAFHALEHAPLASHDLLKIEEHPQAILSFGPSVMILHLEYSVYDIWKSRKSQVSVAPDFSSTEFLVLHKHDGIIYFNKVTKEQGDLLKALQSGISLAAYLHHSTSLNPQDLTRVFYLIASSGLASALRVD